MVQGPLQELGGGGGLVLGDLIESKQYTIDGGGQALTTGLQKSIIYIPWDCTVLEWIVVGPNGENGTITLDLWRDVYANLWPTIVDTITGTDKPRITVAGNKNQSTALTGWTVNLDAEDFLAVNIDAVATFTAINLILRLVRR